MHVEIRAEAQFDLTEGADFYEKQSLGLGDYFLESMFTDLEELASEGGIHAIVHGVHRKLSDIFPFAIYYRLEDDVIEVVAVLDCRQDPESIEAILRRIR